VLAQVRVRIGRYVEALGGGVAMEEIRGQLSACKLREQALLGELAQLSPLIAHALDRAKLRARLEEWKGLLPPCFPSDGNLTSSHSDPKID
jgi:hypothetical protein